jgi:hypothetical protein
VNGVVERDDRHTRFSTLGSARRLLYGASGSDCPSARAAPSAQTKLISAVVRYPPLSGYVVPVDIRATLGMSLGSLADHDSLLPFLGFHKSRVLDSMLGVIPWIRSR